MNVIEIQNLKKTFRKKLSGKPVHALKGISFSVKAGTITGFLGANGAGKTTTIKCLLNLSFADSGEIHYFGKPTLTPEVKARIGFLPERPYFYEYLSGREFLRFYGELSIRTTKNELNERIDRLLKRVGLSHAGDRPLRGYSKGMLQRIGIAQALIHSPEFIILDEPMTGLDPDGRFEVREIIRETAAAGTAVFFSSHLLPDAETLCKEIVVLKLGNLVYQGPTVNLLNQVDNGYDISFLRESNPVTESVATVIELQKTIDRLRSARLEITEIRPKRATLEDAFMKIAFDKEAKS